MHVLEDGRSHSTDVELVIDDDEPLGTDLDGDLLVPRLRKLTIAHSMATPLNLVGLQIWMGAFVAIDYLLHNRKRFRGHRATELGSGTGICACVMDGIFASTIASDVAVPVLEVCLRNVLSNHATTTAVRMLDWSAESLQEQHNGLSVLV